jgi:ABC-type molybdate transport system substrate-binding protein
MKRRKLVMAAMSLPGAALAQAAQGEIVVLAAGSLRRAMNELAAAFERANPGQRVKLVFGASGLLLERIQKGERADVFASATSSIRRLSSRPARHKACGPSHAI